MKELALISIGALAGYFYHKNYVTKNKVLTVEEVYGVVKENAAKVKQCTEKMQTIRFGSEQEGLKFMYDCIKA